jgi:hypothetical protein
MLRSGFGGRDRIHASESVKNFFLEIETAMSRARRAYSGMIGPICGHFAERYPREEMVTLYRTRTILDRDDIAPATTIAAIVRAVKLDSVFSEPTNLHLDPSGFADLRRASFPQPDFATARARR